MSVANLKPNVVSIANDSSSSVQSVARKVTISKAVPTIIANDLTIEGELASSGIVEIEGRIKGVVKGTMVVIRESGFVEGTIIADSLSIRGSFDGKIIAKSVEISSKAKLFGEVEYETFSVEDGASVDGTFKKLS